MNNLNGINKLKEKIKQCKNTINSNVIFYPKDEKEINSFLDKIKILGKIIDEKKFNIYEISKILDNNLEYSITLKNWINQNENIEFKLLYRLSEHGEQFAKFHELCDNNGPLLILYQIKNGDKIGIYTPLILDTNKSGWQNDIGTFIFNLNQNKKYKKIKNDNSLYYDIQTGIYTSYFGNSLICGNMKKLIHNSNYINSFYENGSKILPSKGGQVSYELIEVEVFKVLIN